MKKGLCLAALVALMMAIPARSEAHSYDPNDSDYPLRYLVYAIYPIGVAFQDFVFRPLHKMVSWNKHTAYWFGHQPREEDSY